MSSELESDVCYCRRHLVKATEVTAGLAESHGSLLPGVWLKVGALKMREWKMQEWKIRERKRMENR